MSTYASSALDQQLRTRPTPIPLSDKVMRIATMTKQLLEEVHTGTLDAASLDGLRTIDTTIIDELLTDLAPDLREELQRLALPFTRHNELSDAELRVAHAQLVGWLRGLLQTTRTALSDPHTVATNDSKIVATPNYLDRPHEPCSPTSRLPDEIAPDEDVPAIRSAHHTLITAITRRIAQQRLTAAQAAAVLHLTGPRVTQLLQANSEEFTLEELVNLLPALDLILHVVPAPQQDLQSSA